jgi:peptidylprolyl isomerase
MSEKPEIDFIEGPPPTELVITDLVVGDGAEATPGAQVLVHYLGVDFETGEQFDASWDRGEPIRFPLAGLIAGWQEGIPGMRVGNSSSRLPWPTASRGRIAWLAARSSS